MRVTNLLPHDHRTASRPLRTVASRLCLLMALTGALTCRTDRITAPDIDSAAQIAITPQVSYPMPGDTVNLTVASVGRDGRPTPTGLGALTWAVSDDNIATISPYGVLVARSRGTATVTATSGALTAQAQVLVGSSAPTVIEVAPGALTLQVGQSVTFAASPKDASGASMPSSVVWRSSDTNTVAIDQQGGDAEPVNEFETPG